MRYSVVSDKGVVVSAQSAGSAHRASRSKMHVGSRVEVNRAGKPAEVATRYVGNCQVCEGDFKLYSVAPSGKEPGQDELRMVHHGYKRPGYGYIEGDCPGVGEQPYERSKAIVEDMLRGAEEVSLPNAREWLRKLEAGEVTTLTDTRQKRGTYETEVVHFARETTNAYEWTRMIENRIWRAKAELKFWEERVDHLRKRVANWKLVPVRSFEDIVHVQQVKKQERAAIVAAKREAAAEKRRQIDAKHAAAAEKKRVFLEQARNELIAAAALPTREEGRKAAEPTIARLRLKKNRLLLGYWDDLDADDALIRLGYAEVTQPVSIRRDTGRPYMTYHLYL